MNQNTDPTVDYKKDNNKSPPKVKARKRFSLNFQKRGVITTQEVEDFLTMLNQKSSGRRLDLCDVIADFIHHHDKKDIVRIQRMSMSLMDLIKVKYQKELTKMPKKISFDEYLAKKTGVINEK